MWYTIYTVVGSFFTKDGNILFLLATCKDSRKNLLNEYHKKSDKQNESSIHKKHRYRFEYFVHSIEIYWTMVAVG